MAQSSNTPALLRIGSRGSKLALAQSEAVRARLAEVHGLDPARMPIEVIRTSGDRITDRPLADAGGKGLFAKEIEDALAAGAIDIAVHSTKDLPTFLPDGLRLAAFLPREDARDVFISAKANSLRELERGASVGTSSPRRQALVMRVRPDLNVVPFRGNVETRLRKLDEGLVDATVLALAGLKRLGLAQAATCILPIDEFLPAAGQGAICVEIRADDARVRDVVAAIDDPATAIAIAAERAFLAVLDGSCRTPIAGHATVAGGELRLRGMILKPDGSEAHEITRVGPSGDAAALGADAGRELKRRAGAGFF
jgi:hydroxymethylbilane synthase